MVLRSSLRHDCQVILRSEVQYLKNNGIFVLYYILPLQSILIKSSKNKWHTAKDCENIQRKMFRKTKPSLSPGFHNLLLLIWLVFVALPSLKSWFHPNSFFSDCLRCSNFPHPISSLIMTCLQVFSRKKNFFVICISAPQKIAVSLFAYNTCSSPTSFYPCPRAWTWVEQRIHTGNIFGLRRLTLLLQADLGL